LYQFFAAVSTSLRGFDDFPIPSFVTCTGHSGKSHIRNGDQSACGHQPDYYCLVAKVVRNGLP
jgi:hypothetical protein